MSYAELDVDPARPAYYAGTGGDGPADASGPTVTFHYSRTGTGDAQVDHVTSEAEDPLVEWDTPDGTQAVAQAILRHFTGEEPDQAELEALTMAQGDVWAAEPEWQLTVEALERIVEHP